MFFHQACKVFWLQGRILWKMKKELFGLDKEKCILHKVKKKANTTGHICKGTAF